MKYPPFCPNHECRNHFQGNIEPSGGAWFIKSGFYISCGAKISVQRYKCRLCRRSFSEKTFSVNYCSKKDLNLKRIMQYLASGMSIRAMARIFGCAPDTISRKIGIIARQAAALMSCVFECLDLNEDLVADGFESFAVSQYFPNNFNFLVGKNSQFIYHFNYVQLHRKGRMTDFQRKKASELKKLWPLRQNNELIGFMEITQKIIEMLRRTGKLERLTVFTDEKTEYKLCLERNEPVYKYDGNTVQLTQRCISSKKHRDLRNELFAVNYIDREVRKDVAEHHRETSCFARNVNNSVSRMMVYIFHHNFFKSYRINAKDEKSKSHADAAGIDRRVYNSMMSHILTRRLFISHQYLRGNHEMAWCRAYTTPLKWKSDYLPHYTLAG